MRRFAVDIAAPPDRTWEAVIDVARWPTWTWTVSSVRGLDGDAAAVGSRFDLTQPRLGTATWTVSEVRPGASFTWTTERPGVRTVAAHSVTATPGGGSRVELVVEFQGPFGWLADLLAGGLTDRYIRAEGEALRAALEREAE